MLSSHLYLGLPCDLLIRGFHLNIFLTVLVSGILCTWPIQLSLWALIQLTTFLCFSRFHLHPLNRPVPFLHWESSACSCFTWMSSCPSHNPQPGGPGDFFFHGFLPLAFTDPSVNRKAAVLVLVCARYFLSATWGGTRWETSNSTRVWYTLFYSVVISHALILPKNNFLVDESVQLFLYV